jgi:hypothetical protein
VLQFDESLDDLVLVLDIISESAAATLGTGWSGRSIHPLISFMSSGPALVITQLNLGSEIRSMGLWPLPPRTTDEATPVPDLPDNLLLKRLSDDGEPVACGAGLEAMEEPVAAVRTLLASKA